MTVDDFKTLLAGDMSSHNICQQVLMGSDMWLVTHKGMGDSTKAHDDMTQFFATKLRMAKKNIQFVGSAKTGFSLNPSKEFRAFDDEASDIDVILVSPVKFHEFWEELLRMFYQNRDQIPVNYRREIFRKFVTLERGDQLPSQLFRDWHQHMDALKRDFFTSFTISNPIKYRVYESWEAAESYHESGIDALRTKIAGY